MWSDEDFAEWYPRDGRPGLSPAQLATVSVLKFLLELADRQVAEAVRAALEEIARTDMFALHACMLPEWGMRYGRFARLGKNYETCDEGTVNITTDVATVSATAHETRELAAIHRRLSGGACCRASTWSRAGTPPCSCARPPSATTRSS